jgi:TatA/E family protein of Tat protein translocase
MQATVTLGFLTGAVGPGELLLVFLVVLILFGPRRLPGVARGIGRIFTDLRRAAQDFQDEVMRIEEEPGPAEPAAPEAEEGDHPSASEARRDEAPGPRDQTSEHHDLAG